MDWEGAEITRALGHCQEVAFTECDRETQEGSGQSNDTSQSHFQKITQAVVGTIHKKIPSDSRRDDLQHAEDACASTSSKRGPMVPWRGQLFLSLLQSNNWHTHRALNHTAYG